MNMTYPSKYDKQADVLSKLHWALVSAHYACKWAEARKLSKRFVRARNWCARHGFELNCQ
jgi:hypothetical protein